MYAQKIPLMLLNPRLFELPSSEIKSHGRENLTYGSVTEKGLQSLSIHIKKYIPGHVYGFDLGCGDGELIYHLEKSLDSSRWEGVEISEYRISIQTKDVYIWQGDMLEENFKPYNVLHADNLCLDDITADKLEKKIADEFSGLYITYRYPQNMSFLKQSIYLNTVLTETTWTNHPIYYFQIH
jgi:hypothetical protein